MQPQFPSVSLHLEQKGSQSPGPVHYLHSHLLPGGSSPSYSRYPEEKNGNPTTFNSALRQLGCGELLFSVPGEGGQHTWQEMVTLGEEDSCPCLEPK